MAAIPDLIAGCRCDPRPVGLSLAPARALDLSGSSVRVLRRREAYDLVQGSLVSLNSIINKSSSDLPTAVLLHGILGSRKNWGSFAKRLAQEFPLWQFLLVDLRCHGDSAPIKKRGPHTVASAALDVLKLVGQLRLTPRVLVGHSFGGKVALSMVDQAAKPLARPVRISSKQEVVNSLVQEGFSMVVAQWVVTNLRPSPKPPSSPGFSWVFDLKVLQRCSSPMKKQISGKLLRMCPGGFMLTS